uniref:Uncharacterized protein n=1 Tax=Rhizophora mucronata TaxID=61149 RepID=A0A2P2NWK7_RHIMU
MWVINLWEISFLVFIKQRLT